MTDLRDRLKNGLADRYVIQEELGAGGMATVYLAEDLKNHRKVAVKVLRPELAATLGPERFVREIEIAANLTHPHILPLYDSGETDGFLYYVMPYIEGESLRARLDRDGMLSVDDGIRITDQVASALSYAHEQGVVHRDIKPENILLAGDQAIVADFGIARAVQVAGRERLTGTGLAIGTPEYMSPEQASGSQQIDGRSDVYSLGCTMFEMMCGEPPFTGPTPQAVLARHMNEQLPLIRVVRPQIPAGLQEVIERALAKVPADRYETPNALSAALAAAASAHSARRPVWTRRRRWLAGMSALAMVVLVVLWRALDGPSPPLNQNVIVQYPLEVSGVSSEVTGGGFQLGEDVAYLIVGALDGKATLTWLNGRDFLQDRYLYGDSLRLLRHSEKRALARAQGAGYYVDGRVVPLGLDSVRVFLELHSVERDVPIQRADTVGPTTATASLGVLAMGELLLSLLPAGQAIDVSAVAGLPSEAIQAFVQGERSYRQGKFREAFRHFQSAVEEDRGFALAALKAAQAANMNDNLDEATALINTALAHLDVLSPRDSHMVHGLDAYQHGRAEDALHYFRRAFELDRGRPEALMAIGQTFRHLLPREVPQDSLADVAFAEVYRMVEGFTPVLPYLIASALRRGDLSTATHYLEEFRAAQPEPHVLGISELMLRCVEKSPGAIDWKAQVLADVDRVFQVARSLHIGAAHPPCALGAWRAVVAYDTSSRQAWSYSAMVGLQSLLTAMGRFDDLTTLLDSAAASGSPAGNAIQEFSLLDELAGAPVDGRDSRRAAALREDLASLRDVRLWFLGLWDAYHDRLPEARTIRDILAAFAAVTRGDSIAVDDLLALRSAIAFSGLLGVDSLIDELDEVKQAGAEVARSQNPRQFAALRQRERLLQAEIRTRLERWRRAGHRRLSRLAQSLSAHITVNEGGDATQTIQMLESLAPTAPRPALTFDPWESLGFEWIALARLHLARGDFARAIEVARRFDAPGSVPNIMFLPASLSLRMRAAQELGDDQLAEKMRHRLVALGRGDLVER